MRMKFNHIRGSTLTMLILQYHEKYLAASVCDCVCELCDWVCASVLFNVCVCLYEWVGEGLVDSLPYPFLVILW